MCACECIFQLPSVPCLIHFAGVFVLIHLFVFMISSDSKQLCVITSVALFCVKCFLMEFPFKSLYPRKYQRQISKGQLEKCVSNVLFSQLYNGGFCSVFRYSSDCCKLLSTSIDALNNWGRILSLTPRKTWFYCVLRCVLAINCLSKYQELSLRLVRVGL